MASVNNKTDFSIIIAAYSGAETVSSTLGSIWSQRAADFNYEVIMVIDGPQKTIRQIAEAELARLGRGSEDIRAREIKNRRFDPRTLKLKDTLYQTSTSIEHFLEWVTLDDHILGFLRLSLPFGQPKPSQGSSQATNKSHSGER